DTGFPYRLVRGLSDSGEQCRPVTAGANVRDRHGEKFLAAVSVVRDRGIIDFEEREGFKIVNPHRQRIGPEQSAVTFLVFLELLLTLLALRNIREYHHGTVDLAETAAYRRHRKRD